MSSLLQTDGVCKSDLPVKGEELIQLDAPHKISIREEGRRQ